MYLPRITPMAANALFRPLARAPMPAVAAKATRARINRYSTKPWPASSLCRRARELRTKVIIDVVSSEFLISQLPTPWGLRWVTLCLTYWQIGGQSPRFGLETLFSAVHIDDKGLRWILACDNSGAQMS